MGLPPTPVHRSGFIEYLVCLPNHGYLVLDYAPFNSTTSALNAHYVTRWRKGPSFLISSVSTTFKLEPTIFSVWIQSLRVAPSSQLWLLQNTKQAFISLQKEAAAEGIWLHRLLPMFPLALAKHLRRLGVTDIVVDTPGFNGHTSAADVAWSSIPLVCTSGNIMATRVASSIGNAFQSSAMHVHSLHEFSNTISFSSLFMSS